MSLVVEDFRAYYESRKYVLKQLLRINVLILIAWLMLSVTSLVMMFLEIPLWVYVPFWFTMLLLFYIGKIYSTVQKEILKA